MKAEYRTAWLFPGQGTQEIGMGSRLYRKSPIARYVYGEADQILGYSISQVSFKGPKERLNTTLEAQRAIVAFNHAYYESVKYRRFFHAPDVVLGNSLGEYNALAAARACTFSDVLRLVKPRSSGMQKACEINPGGLRAIIDPTQEQLDTLLDMGLEIALWNTKGQIVVGGRTRVVEKADIWFKQMDIKAIDPGVAGAFHTSCMEPAVEEVMKAVEKVEIKDPEIPIIANTTAKRITTAQKIREELINQLTKPVLWYQSLLLLDELGINQTYEVGDKKILTNMVRRTILGGILGTVVIGGGIIAATRWNRQHEDPPTKAA